MVAWYKHDIPAWMDGTEDLGDGPYRAYHVICQLIYLNEGPIALNEIGIAGRCKQHILAFRRNLQTLIDLKKLSLIDGRLSNDRAATELQSVANHRATSAKGGRGSAGVAKGSRRDDAVVGSVVQRDTTSNHLKTNAPATVPLLHTQHQETREEKTREEKKEHCRVSKETPTKQIYSEEFELNFWKPFPRTAIMSKKEAWREWMKLEPDQRSAACRAIPGYDAHLKKNPTLHAVHACRFLSQNRAEGILEIAAEKPRFDVRAHLA